MEFEMDRYVKAHNEKYSQALMEIKHGKKTSHWMWYIFPQLRGIRNSRNSYYYGLEGRKETIMFINNNYLYNNLVEITKALVDLKESNPIKIFGEIDSIKLKACMTLFYSVTKNALFKSVLDKYYNGGFDEITLGLLLNSMEDN